MKNDPAMPAWAPFLYIGESIVIVLLALYAFSCGVYGSYVYHDNQTISTCIGFATVAYLSAIGTGTRWGIAFPILLLVLMITMGIALDFSVDEWFFPSCWVVYIAVALGIAGYFYKRWQGWVLPLATLFSFAALVGQVTYSPWHIWYIFDTLGLLLMVAETGLRSVATLVGKHYFYSYYYLQRKARNRAAIAAFLNGKNNTPADSEKDGDSAAPQA